MRDPTGPQSERERFMKCVNDREFQQKKRTQKIEWIINSSTLMLTGSDTVLLNYYWRCPAFISDIAVHTHKNTHRVRDDRQARKSSDGVRFQRKDKTRDKRQECVCVCLPSQSVCNSNKESSNLTGVILPPKPSHRDIFSTCDTKKHEKNSSI